MFFCFGLLPLGFGLMRGGLSGKWPGAAAVLIGLAGMMLLMIYPDSIAAFKPATPYLPVSMATSLWLVATGGVFLRGTLEATER